MSLPAGLTTITVTGTYTDALGTAQAGSVSFTPTSAVSDPAGKTILTSSAVVASLVSGSFSLVLPCTDNVGLTPAGWTYTVAVNVGGAQTTFLCYLPHALGSTVDISALSPVPGSPAPSGVNYLPNAQVPPASAPSLGGGFLYVVNGNLYYLGTSGTRTLIAPA